MPVRNANHVPYRRGRCHRTHPAPPRIVGSWRVGRCRSGPARALRAGRRTMARRPIPRLRPRTGVCGKLTIPPAARCAPEACISSQPTRRTTKWRALDSQSPIWQRPAMEINASSFKLRVNVLEGPKAISYQADSLQIKKGFPNAIRTITRSFSGTLYFSIIRTLGSSSFF